MLCLLYHLYAWNPSYSTDLSLPPDTLYSFGHGELGLTVMEGSILHRGLFMVTIARVVDIGIAGIAPAVSPKRAWETKSSNKCSPRRTRSPGPSCSTINRQMVHPETEPREENANGGSKQNVKPVVSEIEPPRRGDEACCCGRDECKHHHEHWRGCASSTNGEAVFGINLIFHRVR